MIKKIEIIPHYMVDTKVEETHISKSQMNEEIKDYKRSGGNVKKVNSTVVIEGPESYIVYASYGR